MAERRNILHALVAGAAGLLAGGTPLAAVEGAPRTQVSHNGPRRWSGVPAAKRAARRRRNIAKKKSGRKVRA
jgi:hypothetical protein